jgi:hypothetical protein
MIACPEEAIVRVPAPGLSPLLTQVETAHG